MTGADALLTGTGSPRDGIIAEILVSVPAISIAGGTDEIQRNIIAERVLGLPKEPRFDTGPFRKVRGTNRGRGGCNKNVYAALRLATVGEAFTRVVLSGRLTAT